MKNRPSNNLAGALRCLFVALLLLTSLAASAQELHTPRYFASRAENYVQANSWEAAKREIDEGLEHYPDDPDLRYLNGSYYYYAQGDLVQARYNLVRSIQENDQKYESKRLLVDVEENAQHYSSAICYINELLEFSPYDRDLWRRKIALYDRIGHKVEAEAALERLARIYPNDTVVRRSLSNRNRETWNERLQLTTLTETAGLLEKWLELDPSNLDYYIELAECYLKLGEFDKAIGTCNRGLARYPRNIDLVRKESMAMTEMGLYTRALEFVRQQGYQGALYNNLLYEAATDARLRDPYEVNGRLFATTGDREALEYLLNTAMTRGYYDDARVYLRESYKIYGRTARLLMKEYALERRFGNESTARRLLLELCRTNPQDEDLSEEYALMILEAARRELEQEQWADAYEHLQTATQILGSAHEAWPSAVAQQITALGHLNRLEEARELYGDVARLDPTNRERFASAYEEIAASRLRGLIELERYEEALAEAEALLTILPQSEAALRTCINMSQTLKRSDDFYRYANLGYLAFPDVPYFIVKHAVALQEQGLYPEALDLLRPRTEHDEYINPQLIAAYSGLSQEWAELLLKEHIPDIALKRIEAALFYDPKNTDLLYLKGLAHEQLKQFDLAYQYQHRYYEPSNAEQQEWYQHMRYLRYRSYRNRMDVSYTRAMYDTRSESLASTGHLYSIASVAYSRLTKSNTYTGQLSYKGIDGYHEDGEHESGGVGIEAMLQWEHTFNHRWSWLLSGSYSTKYFNKWGANITVSYAANRDWTPSLRLGYRRTPPTYLYLSDDLDREGEYYNYNLFLITPSLSKKWGDRIITSGAVDLIATKNSLFYNLTGKGKLFINDDNITSVSLLAGFGTFPELTFFEQTALHNRSRLNAMVGFDASCLLTYNCYVTIAGSWNTCYNPFRRSSDIIYDSFRNIYSFTVQLHVAF